jgi:hypothetical protein
MNTTAHADMAREARAHFADADRARTEARLIAVKGFGCAILDSEARKDSDGLLAGALVDLAQRANIYGLGGSLGLELMAFQNALLGRDTFPRLNRGDGPIRDLLRTYGEALRSGQAVG